MHYDLTDAATSIHLPIVGQYAARHAIYADMTIADEALAESMVSVPRVQAAITAVIRGMTTMLRGRQDRTMHRWWLDTATV
jgi:hypothetical protein